jgi:hypothetical protein
VLRDFAGSGYIDPSVRYLFQPYSHKAQQRMYIRYYPARSVLRPLRARGAGPAALPGRGGLGAEGATCLPTGARSEDAEGPQRRSREGDGLPPGSVRPARVRVRHRPASVKALRCAPTPSGLPASTLTGRRQSPAVNPAGPLLIGKSLQTLPP